MLRSAWHFLAISRIRSAWGPFSSGPRSMSITFTAYSILSRDYNFAFGAPFSKILERGRNFMQRIKPVNDRGDFARGTEFRDIDQIFSVWLHRQDAYLLAPGSLNPWSQEQDLEQCSDSTAD